MSSINHQVRLAARPSGLPKASDWELTSEPPPTAGPGQFTVAISHLSVDPAMRGWRKCRALIEEFGFDAAIDYKSEDLRTALREHAPAGLDVYFDNVGGDVLDAVLTRLARGARIIICGAVSQYNSEQVRGPANYLSLLVARASMTGMLVFDYQDRYPRAMAELAGWLRAGQLVSREHVVHGSVSDFPAALLMLFAGENTGKLILALDRG